jgi:TRAP-type C4-dicarboxylate transport system permease small subunit
MNRFASLADHKFRVLGLAISILAIVLLGILHILNFEYEPGWHDRIFIINHFIIVFGLYMLMFSKEILDDERVQRIGYTLIKMSYALTMTGILVYMSITTLDKVELSIYVILYIIEAVLILYQLLFRYCLARDPLWIFKETTRGKFGFYYLSFSLLFLIGWIIYVVIQYKI